MTRLAIVASHPIQYQAPLFRELARRIDCHVFFAHRATPAEQARAGFDAAFDWDVDLLSGYESAFLRNVSARPGVDRFAGCDTPEIGARLAAGRFGAALVMGWHLKSFIQTVWAARRLGLPAMARGDSQLGTPRSALKRMTKDVVYPTALRAFGAALYVGQRSRAYYEHYGYPGERLFFSPHCVDTEWFAARATAEARAETRRRAGIPEGAPVVLFAGKLMALKRPLDILEALGLEAFGMEALGRGSGESRPVHVLVAGSGELEAALRQRAEELAIPLHLLGFQNQSEMPAAYAAADVLVLPSASETWGLVANEALACGVPIVVSDACGCAPDLAADGAAGRVFPVGDASALACAIGDVLARPPSRAAIWRKSNAHGLAAAAAGVEAAFAAVAGASLWTGVPAA